MKTYCCTVCTMPMRCLRMCATRRFMLTAASAPATHCTTSQPDTQLQHKTKHHNTRLMRSLRICTTKRFMLTAASAPAPHCSLLHKSNAPHHTTSHYNAQLSNSCQRQRWCLPLMSLGSRCCKRLSTISMARKVPVLPIPAEQCTKGAQA